MGEAKRRKQLDPNFGKPKDKDEILKKYQSEAFILNSKTFTLWVKLLDDDERKETHDFDKLGDKIKNVILNVDLTFGWTIENLKSENVLFFGLACFTKHDSENYAIMVLPHENPAKDFTDTMAQLVSMSVNKIIDEITSEIKLEDLVT